MSVVVTGHAENTDATPDTTIAVTLTVSSGERLVLFFTYDISTGQAVETISDTQTNTWSGVLNFVDETGNQRVGCAECISPAAGSTTITVNLTGSRSSRGVHVIRISGATTNAAEINPVNTNWQATPGLSTDAVTSGNITPISDAGLFIGCSMCTHTSGGGTPAVGTGFTSITSTWNFSGFDNARTEYKAFSSTTPAPVLFTATGNRDHLTLGVAIDAAISYTFFGIKFL